MKLFKRDYDLRQNTNTGEWEAWPRPTWWTQLLIALLGAIGAGAFYGLTYWWLPDLVRHNLVRPLLSIF